MIPTSNFFAGNKSYLEFKDFQDDESSDDEYKNDEFLKQKDDEQIGNLSPIGNPYMKDEVEDNFDTGYFSPTGRGMIKPLTTNKGWIDDLVENQYIPEKQGGS